jgi:hypothetical protein
MSHKDLARLPHHLRSAYKDMHQLLVKTLDNLVGLHVQNETFRNSNFGDICEHHNYPSSSQSA